MTFFSPLLAKLKFRQKPINECHLTTERLPATFENKAQDSTYVLEIVSNKQNTKCIGSNWLINFKNNQNSEHGEDGIITKIFEIMGAGNKWVCEFGAHDPEIISNTWQLINKKNWKAVLIEGDSFYAKKLTDYYKNNDSVFCINNLVSFEGEQKLDSILKNTPIPTDMDFMIVDIDGNDYHVWEAISLYRAKVVMIEFNASIPTDISFVQPKNLTINQGSSLKAMVDLSAKKGYKLIAVTSWNAFFVQEQYYNLFFKEVPPLDDMYVYPVKHPIWMRPFQLYDGTILIAPWNQLLWHKVNLTNSDCQVLPESLRNFSYQLLTQNYIFENSPKKIHFKEEIATYLDKIYKMPGNSLSKFAKNVFSTYGEDGIIESLIPLLKSESPYFVEIGAGDGISNSRSRNLIDVHGLSGVQIESNKELFNLLEKNNSCYNKIQLCNAVYSLVDENSLDNLLDGCNVPKNLDILFLNDYGMEYYLWESLKNYLPKIVIVQFNPTIPNDVKFIQAKNFSIHQGCSLRALYDLALYKDYDLVAVTLETAFFVRKKLVHRLLELYNREHQTDLDDIFCPAAMKWFQLYDGTLVARGLTSLLWHRIRIDEEKIQVIPKGIRKFHQFVDKELKKHFYRI